MMVCATKCLPEERINQWHNMQEFCLMIKMDHEVEVAQAETAGIVAAVLKFHYLFLTMLNVLHDITCVLAW
jgi:hypothetical protein